MRSRATRRQASRSLPREEDDIAERFIDSRIDLSLSLLWPEKNKDLQLLGLLHEENSEGSGAQLRLPHQWCALTR